MEVQVSGARDLQRPEPLKTWTSTRDLNHHQRPKPPPETHLWTGSSWPLMWRRRRGGCWRVSAAVTPCYRLPCPPHPPLMKTRTSPLRSCRRRLWTGPWGAGSPHLHQAPSSSLNFALATSPEWKHKTIRFIWWLPRCRGPPSQQGAPDTRPASGPESNQSKFRSQKLMSIIAKIRTFIQLEGLVLKFKILNYYYFLFQI